jgi:hypothetical protein
MQFGPLERCEFVTLLGAGAAAWPFVATIATAQAQTYPSKPITIIVPFAAGGQAMRWRAPYQTARLSRTRTLAVSRTGTRAARSMIICDAFREGHDD